MSGGARNRTISIRLTIPVDRLTSMRDPQASQVLKKKKKGRGGKFLDQARRLVRLGTNPTTRLSSEPDHHPGRPYGYGDE